MKHRGLEIRRKIGWKPGVTAMEWSQLRRAAITAYFTADPKTAYDEALQTFSSGMRTSDSGECEVCGEYLSSGMDSLCRRCAYDVLTLMRDRLAFRPPRREGEE